MMGNLKAIAALAALAAGAAALMLTKKKTPADSSVQETKGKPVERAKNEKTGEYDFVGGYSTARKTSVKFSYDADAFTFSVPEDYSINDTNVSHVAILNADKLDVQLEYAEFFPGEAMPELKAAASKHADFEELCFGENGYYKFTEGDSIILCCGIKENPECYLVFSVFKAKDNDDKLAALLEYPELRALLASVQTVTGD